MTRKTNRRDFLKTGAAAGVGFWVAGGVSLAQSTSANEKVTIAGIGCGGKGHSDILKCVNAGQNVIAGCDIDMGRANSLAGDVEKKGAKRPQLFEDYRVMFDKLGKEVDAVTVSIPDHSHAVAAARAIDMGKHVYVQKPLTHTVQEARVLRTLAKSKGICSQMGNQGTTLDSLRTGVEIIQSGVIGDVSEVHVWSNRPVWPQGAAMTRKFQEGKGAKVPANFNFPLWLGPASQRPYNGAYGHFIWRGFWDFGTGALGDMACHTMNLPFWALSLEYPTSIKATVPAVYEVTPPEWSTITFEFPARTVLKTGKKLPAVSLTWYDGNTRQGALPQEHKHYAEAGRKFGVDLSKNGESGSLFVGEKGALWSPGDYADDIYLLPESKFPPDNPQDDNSRKRAYKKFAPTPWLPRHAGGDMDQNQTNEWLAAIKAGKPDLAMSNFEYAAYFTEIILLGNLAMRVPGELIQWNGPAMKSTNSPKANTFVGMKYRKGFELPRGAV